MSPLIGLLNGMELKMCLNAYKLHSTVDNLVGVSKNFTYATNPRVVIIDRAGTD